MHTTLPLTADTLGLFDAKTIGRMKAGSFLINPGRGSLVDEEAVADALLLTKTDLATPETVAALRRRLGDAALRVLEILLGAISQRHGLAHARRRGLERLVVPLELLQQPLLFRRQKPPRRPRPRPVAA